MQDKLLTSGQLMDTIDSFFLDFYSLHRKQYNRELAVRDNPLNKSIAKVVKSIIKMLGKTYFVSYDNPGIIL